MIQDLLRQAIEADRQDPLAAWRDAFVITDPDTIYLDGNSLGRLPRQTRERLLTEIETGWGDRLIRGWNDGWWEAPRRIGAKVATLIGAGAEEVWVGDSTSVNLFKLAWAACQARPDRRVIVTDNLNFPSDIYVLQGLATALGCELRMVPSPDGLRLPVEALAAQLGADVALVVLSHVAFRSGYLYDMAAITERVHAAGALMLWDLSHSAGAVEVALDACNVDLAVGCTYKYLNGGPGAPAYLHIRRDLQPQLRNPIQGWAGMAAPFSFDLTYRPAAGIGAFAVGTPPILSLSAIEPGLDLLLAAGLPTLRAKSVALGEFLIYAWERELAPLRVSLNSPRAPAERGAHVSLGHPEGYRISRALIEYERVIPDFRAPDNLRLGLAPLYTRFTDVAEFVLRLKRVLVEKHYLAIPDERNEIVT
jgi:kynureninase